MIAYRHAVVIGGLALFLFSACGRWSSLPALSVGPVPASPETVARLQTVVQARGYTVIESVPGNGMLRVNASTTTRRGSYTFTLQCYQEGWVSVIPNGPGVRRDGDQWVMPAGLAQEYLDLSVALTESLVPTAGGRS